mmetsp:Transcript_26882/g.64125  ORF Transcript_26882/g.64125 Transcript_26882/m.64125 type:complete len:118 (+) Transcript_26882:79-432(+)
MSESTIYFLNDSHVDKHRRLLPLFFLLSALLDHTDRQFLRDIHNGYFRGVYHERFPLNILKAPQSYISSPSLLPSPPEPPAPSFPVLSSKPNPPPSPPNPPSIKRLAANASFLSHAK